MIVSSAPLRISLFGGGSDLPNFILNQKYGAVLSFTINSRVYTILHKLYKSDNYLLKYSKVEEVSTVSEIQHPIIRRIFQKYEISGVELAVISDVPAGTGMGSSSAFTVSLLNTVHKYLNISKTRIEVANEACQIEIEDLNAPIGFQDQFASALGGFNLLNFQLDSRIPKVSVIKNFDENNVTQKLMSNLIMVEIGSSRSANTILAKQSMELQRHNSSASIQTIKLRDIAMRYMQDGYFTYTNVVNDLVESWRLKKRIIDEISNDEINDAYNLGMRLGAEAGKLGGAGGSGFLIFLVPERKQESFMQGMSKRNLFSFKPMFSKEGLI